MISTDRDSGSCGEGEAAEISDVARTSAVGRDENIGATVTQFLGVALFDIGSQDHGMDSAVIFYFVFHLAINIIN